MQLDKIVEALPLKALQMGNTVMQLCSWMKHLKHSDWGITFGELQLQLFSWSTIIGALRWEYYSWGTIRGALQLDTTVEAPELVHYS